MRRSDPRPRTRFRARRGPCFGFVAFGLLSGAGVTAAMADGTARYRFEIVDNTKVGLESKFAVQLMDTRTGKAVPGAIFDDPQLDLAPQGMADVTAPVLPLPDLSPGVYQFRTRVMTKGKWRLHLNAKVGGDTVDDTLVLQVDE